jgi:hypothetical protein
MARCPLLQADREMIVKRPYPHDMVKTDLADAIQIIDILAALFGAGHNHNMVSCSTG